MRSHFALRSEFPTCPICNEEIELETAKIDEVGRPVHEECYVQRVKKSIRPPPGASYGEDNENPFLQQIVTFLDSAKHTHAITNFCPVCGSQLEHRTCTFLYAERTWEIRLAIRHDCATIDSTPPHDA